MKLFHQAKNDRMFLDKMEYNDIWQRQIFNILHIQISSPGRKVSQRHHDQKVLRHPY